MTLLMTLIEVFFAVIGPLALPFAVIYTAILSILGIPICDGPCPMTGS